MYIDTNVAKVIIFWQRDESYRGNMKCGESYSAKKIQQKNFTKFENLFEKVNMNENYLVPTQPYNMPLPCSMSMHLAKNS
jgi:hypothetical protein